MSLWVKGLTTHILISIRGPILHTPALKITIICWNSITSITVGSERQRFRSFLLSGKYTTGWVEDRVENERASQCAAFLLSLIEC